MSSKEGTLHLVYQRQYFDDEDCDYFFINHTIFRNVPLSQLARLNDKNFKAHVKAFCDKNYVESASNYDNYSEVNMITGEEYYKTYEGEYGKTAYGDKSYYTDYGQKYNTRQCFKHDFNKEVTKLMGGII